MIKIEDKIIEQWKNDAKNTKVSEIEIKGEKIQAKFIIDANMPQGLNGYNFMDDAGNLVIVTRSSVSVEGIAQEAAYHEFAEAQWLKTLSPSQAHILASAQQALVFGQTGITPFHQSQIDNMTIDTILSLISENRDSHHILIEAHMGKDVSDKVQQYESQFLSKLFNNLASIINSADAQQKQDIISQLLKDELIHSLYVQGIGKVDNYLMGIFSNLDEQSKQQFLNALESNVVGKWGYFEFPAIRQMRSELGITQPQMVETEFNNLLESLKNFDGEVTVGNIKITSDKVDKIKELSAGLEILKRNGDIEGYNRQLDSLLTVLFASESITQQQRNLLIGSLPISSERQRRIEAVIAVLMDNANSANLYWMGAVEDVLAAASNLSIMLDEARISDIKDKNEQAVQSALPIFTLASSLGNGFDIVEMMPDSGTPYFSLEHISSRDVGLFSVFYANGSTMPSTLETAGYHGYFQTPNLANGMVTFLIDEQYPLSIDKFDLDSGTQTEKPDRANFFDSTENQSYQKRLNEFIETTRNPLLEKHGYANIQEMLSEYEKYFVYMTAVERSQTQVPQRLTDYLTDFMQALTLAKAEDKAYRRQRDEYVAKNASSDTPTKEERKALEKEFAGKVASGEIKIQPKPFVDKIFNEVLPAGKVKGIVVLVTDPATNIEKEFNNHESNFYKARQRAQEENIPLIIIHHYESLSESAVEKQNVNLLYRDLVRDSVKRTYVEPLVTAIKSGNFDQSNLILSKLKLRPSQKRLLDEESVKQIVSAVEVRLKDSKPDSQHRLDLISLIADLGNVIAVDYAEISVVENSLKRIVDKIVSDSSSSLLTKRTAIIKLQQFYDNIAGSFVDVAFISRMENKIQSDLQGRQIGISSLNSRIEVITSPEDYIQLSDKIDPPSKDNIIDRILDIESSSAISNNLKPVLITGIIKLYENQNLSLAAIEKLVDNLIKFTDSVDQIQGISESAKMVLVNYIINAFSVAAMEGAVDQLRLSQAYIFVDALVKLAQSYGNDFTEVITFSNIRIVQNAPNISETLIDNTIVLDQSALANTKVLEFFLLREVLKRNMGLTDSNADSIVLQNELLNFAIKNGLTGDLENFLVSNRKISTFDLQNYIQLLQDYQKSSSEDQQVSLIAEYVTRNSYRSAGYTDLEIDRIMPQIRQEIINTKSEALLKIKDIQLGERVKFSFENGRIVMDSDFIDIRLNLPANIADTLKAENIKYAGFKASANQIRIITNDNKLYVFDISQSTPLLVANFNQLYTGSSFDVLVENQINGIISSTKDNGVVINGMVQDRKVEMQVQGIPLSEVLSGHLRNVSGDSTVASIIDKLKSGKIEVVVADNIPGTFKDGNRFMYVHQDTATGKGIIFISKNAWDRLNVGEIDFTDSRMDAFVGALIKAGFHIEGKNISQLRNFQEWNTLEENYSKYFQNDLLLDDQLKQAVNAELNKINEKSRELSLEREKIAQELAKQKEIIDKLAEEKFYTIPSLKLHANGQEINLEQWKLDELGTGEFIYLSFGENLQDKLVIDLKSFTEKTVNGFTVKNIDGNLVISYSDTNSQSQINLLTDALGNLQGYVVKRTDLKGNTTTSVYDRAGNIQQDFKMEFSPQVQAILFGGVSLGAIQRQIDESKADPEKTSQLKLQFINAILNQSNQFLNFEKANLTVEMIDKLYGQISNTVFDQITEELTVPGAQANQIVKDTLAKNQLWGFIEDIRIEKISLGESASTGYVEFPIDYQQVGNLDKFSLNGFDSTKVSQIPFTYVEGNRIYVFDAQGRRYEFALKGETVDGVISIKAGELIGVTNMLNKDLHQRLGIDLGISDTMVKDYTNNLSQIDFAIEKFKKEILALEQKQVEALKNLDTDSAKEYALKILKLRAQIGELGIQRLAENQKFIQLQREASLIQYNRAIRENKSYSTITLYQAIEKAAAAELGYIESEKEAMKEKINKIAQNIKQARSEIQGAEQGAQDQAQLKTGALNIALNQLIEDRIKNQKLGEFLAEITSAKDKIDVTLEGNKIIQVSVGIIREKLLDRDNFNKIVDYVNTLPEMAKDQLKQALDIVIKVAFDRAGAASITGEYEKAVLSAVMERAKKAGFIADEQREFTDLAQDYINQLDHIISSNGKDRSPIQLKKIAERNKATILKRMYGEIDSVLDSADLEIINMSVLENKKAMISGILGMEGLVEGTPQYTAREYELNSVAQGLLQRIYMMERVLNLQDQRFSETLKSVLANKSALIEKILELEGLKGTDKYNDRKNELVSANLSELLINFLALSMLDKNFIRHDAANFSQMYSMITKSDEGVYYLKAAMLSEENIKNHVDRKVQDELKKEKSRAENAKKEGKTYQPLTEQAIRNQVMMSSEVLDMRDRLTGMLDANINSYVAEKLKEMIREEKERRIAAGDTTPINQAEIEAMRISILQSPELNNVREDTISQLKNHLKENLVKSGKYTDKINKRLETISKELQKEYANYDLINGQVPEELIRRAVTAVMLSMLVDKGFYYHDVQLFSGTLLANGGILNVGTGEGKTFTSALSLYIHSLSGETAIQFLTQEAFARNDSEEVGGILSRLGVDVEVVTKDTDRAKVKDLLMRKADRGDDGSRRVVYIPFSDFAFMKLEDIYYADDQKVLPKKLAYANFDEIDALVFEGSLMDFINAQISDPLTMADEQVYRLVWDFVLKIRSDAAQLEKIKETDPNFQLFRGIIDSVVSSSKATDMGLYTIHSSSEGNFVELAPSSDDIIKKLFEAAKQQGYKLGSYDQFREIVKITIEQHLFHREKVNWTLEDKKDQSGNIVKNDKGIVRDIKLINAQGEHTNQRQSHHRHTIMEVWAKYYLGENIEVLGDSETTGKIGGADVIKSFDKFSGFSGSIATEVARDELKKLYKKDTITEMASFIQKVIERQDTAVFQTSGERNSYLLSQIDEIFRNRDAAPILAGTRSYDEAEALYSDYMNRLEIAAKEQLNKIDPLFLDQLRKIVPADVDLDNFLKELDGYIGSFQKDKIDNLLNDFKQKLLDLSTDDQQRDAIRESMSKLEALAGIKMKIAAFRYSKSVRGEGDTAAIRIKQELAVEIGYEINNMLSNSYIQMLNSKKVRLNEILEELRLKHAQATDESVKTKLNEQIKDLESLLRNYDGQISNIVNLQSEIQKLFEGWISDQVARNYKSATAKLELIKAKQLAIIEKQAQISDSIPSEFRGEFDVISKDMKSNIDGFISGIDRMSKVHTFHGNSFRTEQEERDFLGIAGQRGSVTFVNPYGTRGKDFKLSLFKISSFNDIISKDLVKQAIGDFLAGNPAVLDELVALVAEKPGDADRIKALLKDPKNLEYGLYSELNKLIQRFDDDRDSITRTEKENKINQFFDIIKQAVATEMDNPMMRDSYLSQINELQQNLRVEKSYGYQVFEVGISVSERITMQLFGRGGRQSAPRTEQTLISLDLDQGQIAIKAFEGIGTKEGNLKHLEFLSSREQMDEARSKIRAGLSDMLFGKSEADLTEEQKSVLDIAFNSALIFKRSNKLDGILGDISQMVQATLINQGKNEIEAREITSVFIEKLKTGLKSKEDFSNPDIIAEAEELGLNKMHLDKIAEVRFDQTTMGAVSQLEQIILTERAKDFLRSQISEEEKKMDQGALDNLLNYRADQLVSSIKSPSAFATREEYDSYIAALGKMGFDVSIAVDISAKINDVVNNVIDYTAMEKKISSLFSQAQNLLDIIDSEKRISKSYFDDVEYSFAQQVGEIKGAIEAGKHKTADGQDFGVALNEQLINLIFDRYEKSKDFEQLKRDLRTIKIDLKDDAKDFINAIKDQLIDQVKRGILNFQYDGFLEDAFRGANASLLIEWSRIKNEYSHKLRQKTEKLKKDGMDKSDVRKLFDLAFDTAYNKDTKEWNYRQLQKNLAALGIVITEDDFSRIDEIRQQITKDISSAKITLDFIIFGGALGKEFDFAASDLRNMASQMRTSYQEKISKETEAIIKEFSDKIKESFDKFVNSLATDYAQAIFNKHLDILRNVERSESVGADIAEKNTLETVSRAVDRDLIQRKIRLSQQVVPTAAFAKKVAGVLDKGLTWLAGVFGKNKNMDQLVTKKKSTDLNFDGLFREAPLAPEATPAAIFPLQTMQIIEDKRSMEEKKQLVTPDTEIGVQDGQIYSRKIDDQSQTGVSGQKGLNARAIEIETINGRKVMKLEVDDASRAGDAIIAALKTYSASKGGSVDIDGFTLVSKGKDIGTIDIGKSAVFHLMDQNQSARLNNIINNGGMMEIEQELIVFGKNSNGVTEGHNLGSIRDINPDLIAIFEIKKIDMMSFIQMNEEQRKTFFAQNPIASHPLFAQVLFNPVTIENGVILIGNNQYNKDIVEKGTLLVNSKLGDDVKVGRNSVIINSEIGLVSGGVSEIGDKVEIRNTKIGKQLIAGVGATLDSVISNNVNIGESAVAERVNARTANINIGKGSLLMDFEGDGYIDIKADYFKQGNDDAKSVNEKNLTEIILKKPGKFANAMKSLQRKFYEWSKTAEDKYPNQKRITKLLKFLSNLFGSFTPEARQWKAMYREKAKFADEYKEKFKDQRARLQNDLSIPYNMMFGIDPDRDFHSAVISEMDKIARDADPNARKAMVESFVADVLSTYPESIRQQISELMDLSLNESIDQNKPFSEVFVDKITSKMEQIINELPSYDTFDKLHIAEAFSKLQKMSYFDEKLTQTDSLKIALRGIELSEKLQDEQAKITYLINALNSNAILLLNEPSDKQAKKTEFELLKKFGWDNEKIFGGLNNALTAMRDKIADELFANLKTEGLSGDQITQLKDKSGRIADQLVGLINLGNENIPVGLNQTIITRQFTEYIKGKEDNYPLIRNLQIKNDGKFNSPADKSVYEQVAQILSELNISMNNIIPVIAPSKLDPSAQWVFADEIWINNIANGLSLYGDKFFNTLQTVLSGYSTLARNEISDFILKTYSRSGSSVNILEHVSFRANALISEIESGKYYGEELVTKLETAHALMNIAALLMPTDKDTLKSYANLNYLMAEQVKDRIDINTLDKDALASQLLKSGVAVSLEQGLKLADSIIAKREATPIRNISGLDLLSPQQAELLRANNIVGSQETAAYYNETARTLISMAINIAKENNASDISELLVKQVDYLIGQRSMDTKKIDSILKEANDKLSLIDDRDKKSKLSDQIDYLNFKNLISQNKNTKPEDAQKAIDEFVAGINETNRFYPEILMQQAEFFINAGNFQTADSIFKNIIEQYPDKAGEIENKKIQVALNKGTSIDFMVVNRPETVQNEQKAKDLLGIIQQAIASNMIAESPDYIASMLNELILWNKLSTEKGLSAGLKYDVLKTIGSISANVGQFIVANLSNPQKAEAINAYLQIQDQIINPMINLQSYSEGSPAKAVERLMTDKVWVDADGKVMDQNPTLAVIRDNMDMNKIDPSGYLGEELQKYKIGKLNDFISVFAPDAKIEIVGDHILVTGLTALQVRYFNSLFTSGFTTSIENLKSALKLEAESMFNSFDGEELAEKISSRWGISIKEAYDIGAMKGQPEDKLIEKLASFINDKLKINELPEQARKKLESDFSQNLQSAILSILNKDLDGMVQQETPEENLKPMKDLIADIEAKNVFGDQNFRLIIGIGFVPPDAPPLANLLKDKKIEEFRQRSKLISQPIEDQINILQVQLDKLPEGDAGKQAIQIKIDSLKSRLDNLVKIGFMDNMADFSRNMFQNVLIQAMADFSQAEQAELARMQDKTVVSTPEAAISKSNFIDWVYFWQSTVDKGLKDSFADNYNQLSIIRDNFQYFQKLSSGVQENELAGIRNRVTNNLIDYLGKEEGSQVAPIIITMIEQNKGDVQKTMNLLQTFLGEGLVSKVKAFFLPSDKPVEGPVTMNSIYQIYSEKISQIIGFTVDKKFMEMSLNEKDIFSADEVSILRNMGVINPYGMSIGEMKTMKLVLKQIAKSKQNLTDWLNNSAIGLQEQRNVITDTIFETQPVLIGQFSNIQLEVLKSLVAKLNLNLKIDSNGNVYVVPEVDISQSAQKFAMVKNMLESAGVDNPEVFINSLKTNESIKAMFQLPDDEMAAIDLVFNLKDIGSVNDYFNDISNKLIETAGFKAFKTSNPVSAVTVEEFFNSLKNNSSVNGRKVDLYGYNFILKRILNDFAVQEFLNNEDLRKNSQAVNALRIMLASVNDMYRMIIAGESAVDNAEIIANNSQIKDAFADISNGLKKISDEMNQIQRPSITSLEQIKSGLTKLVDLFDKLTIDEANKSFAVTQDKPNNIELIMKDVNKYEKEIMRICLSNISGVTEVSDDELGAKFFKAVESNKGRVDIFMKFISDIVNNTYLSSGHKDSANYLAAVATLKTKINSYITDVLGAASPQNISSSVVEYKTPKFDDKFIERIIPSLDQDSATKLKSILASVDANIGIDVVQNKLIADPVVDRLLTQLENLSSPDLRNRVFDEKIKGYIGLLFDQAIELSSAQEAVFPELYKSMKDKSTVEIRNAIVSIIANLYLGLPLSGDLKNLLPQLKPEISSFVSKKMPYMSQVEIQETNTDRRVMLVQVLKDNLGENIFDLAKTDDKVKNEIRSFLISNINPLVSEKNSDNRYVFVINFDALAQNGKISVNESNFMLKETIQFIEQMVKDKGKDVKFVIVSENYTSEAVLDQLSALRITELQVDVFAKDLGDGNKTMQDLIQLVQNNYSVNNQNLKLITESGNQQAREIARQLGVQIMEVNPGFSIDNENGESMAETFVGSLNLFVQASINGYTNLPAKTKILAFNNQDTTKNPEVNKLYDQIKQSETEFSKFGSVEDLLNFIRTQYGFNQKDDVLKDILYKSITAYILDNKINLTPDLNLKIFESEFSGALKSLLGENIGNILFDDLFSQSLVNLVLQSPKQKISSAYLREYERMKMAEEFA